MSDTRSPQPRSGLVTGARWLLLILATLFTLGALGQFFLVGLSMFDNAARWNDHAALGHIIGMLPWVMWIPAVLGKTGRTMIIATVLLFLLFEAQYAYINVDNSVANALHPLNGSVLLVLGFWITQRSVRLVREDHRQPGSAAAPTHAAHLPDKLEGRPS